ncbi:MAG TPA: molecular chaperone TorD family protein [Gemmatimonadaceae bacterium]
MTDVQIWLERAAAWRFAARLFQEPDPARAEELATLAAALAEPLRAEALALASTEAERSERYFAVLGPGGCPATESAYDLAAMANRGPLIAEVSAFYEAFSYPARLTSDVAPDHLVVELDFMGFLAFKVAYALHGDRAGDRAVAEAAYADFRDRHVRFWLEAFRDRLHETNASPFAAAAEWTCQVVETEWTEAHVNARKGAGL